MKRPADLFKMHDPIGPDNQRMWEMVADFQTYGAKVVCAWGANQNAVHRGYDFLEFAAHKEMPVYCLGQTKGGHPRHPLYVPGDQPLELYQQ